MSDDSYSKAYDAGRNGGMYTGGNSIDYAGYAEGRRMRAAAESQGSGGGGGGGGAVNFKGKVVLVGLGFGMFGMFWGFLSTASWAGGIIGFTVAFIIGATIRLLLAGLGAVLTAFGRIFPFVLPMVAGWFLGLCIGAVASDQGHTPRQSTMLLYAWAGAGIFFALWLLRRLLARKSS
ncbi:MAG: hypothetical protein FD129_1027 [bacterium]|nr:MAG: hypothetical protein FD129_1027 [bacterium]